MITFVLILWLSSLAAIPPSHTHRVRPGRAAAITQTSDIAKGQVVERMTCAGEPNQTYALYLPSNYSPEKKWPVLYAFDPGARGKIPAERFREPAEKYGWIVVASNNSRNGPGSRHDRQVGVSPTNKNI